MFKVVFAVVVIVLLSGIYEQLSVSNMTEQQRAQHMILKQHETAAKLIADSERIKRDERIASLDWSELQNDKDRSTWLFNNAMPWLYSFIVFGVFWVLVQMVLNRRNR